MERSWAGVGQELGKSWTGVWHAILGKPRAADSSAHSAGPINGNSSVGWYFTLSEAFRENLIKLAYDFGCGL